MAYTERYVTSAAAGSGVGTEGYPWTLSESFSQAVAGDRVNILSDAGYSSGVPFVYTPSFSPVKPDILRDSGM